jgi:hypothetical protein
MTDRQLCHCAVLAVLVITTMKPNVMLAEDNRGIVDVGSRRELFVDRFLIDRLGNTTLKLHEPKLAPETPKPADTLEYATVIMDEGLFRLYTRDASRAKDDGDAGEVTRYCESHDGIHWTRPKLGLYEVDGSKENNVILAEPPYCHNFSPFLDQHPGRLADQRFKALAGLHDSGLVAFVSGDGIHWRKLQSDPVIPARVPWKSRKLFDSQNVSFWSEAEECYVCYFRSHVKGLRKIARTTSDDYRNWSKPVLLDVNVAGEHLYTSQTHPYFRAPHIYIALPTRYFPDRGSSTDILFMSARGDGPFDRSFRQAFIRPGLDPARWGNRSNYTALNVVPTGQTEMSIYVTPRRRFVLRTDGFTSVHAAAEQGEMITRPLRFTGQQLVVNYSTSAGGSLQVEIQDVRGKPLPGFALTDCERLVGDSIEQRVEWSNSGQLASLVNQSVRLRFVLQDADLFAIQFRN